MDLSAEKSACLVCARVLDCVAVCAYRDFSAQYVFARAVLEFDVADTHHGFFVHFINKVDFSVLNNNAEMSG